MFIEMYEEILKNLVGRERELWLILSALEAGEHLLLEGPPGTSKSTILANIVSIARIPFYKIEGSADLTPTKLVGYFQPSEVLSHGYKPDFFEAGPLLRSMQGGILYIEEFNRMPSDTANVLISAIDGELNIPRLGPVSSDNRLFRVVCAQNPYDDVGTLKVSRAFYDRVSRIKMDYQTEEEEIEIVKRNINYDRGSSEYPFICELIKIFVKIARLTRSHPDVKQGVSVRGAISATRMITANRDWIKEVADIANVLRDICFVTMSGRIWLKETCERTPEEILMDILLKVLSEESLLLEKEPGRPVKAEESNRPVKAKEKGEKEKKKRLVRSQLIDKISLSGEAFSIEEGEIEYDISMLGKEQLKNIAREIAERVISRVADASIENAMGSRLDKLKVQKYRESEDAIELELDRTIEEMVNSAGNTEESLYVYLRERRERSCSVIIDHSKSMTGLKLLLASLVAAVVVYSFKEQSCIIEFNTTARVMKPLRSYMELSELIEGIVSLEAEGFTNFKDALELAALQVRDMPRKVAILVTDGQWTKGGDPIPTARKFDKLHVISTTDSSGFAGTWFAKKMATAGNGKFFEVKDLYDVTSALFTCIRDI